MRIEVSGPEYDAQRLDEPTLVAAVAALDDDGYVVLGGAVDTAVLDALRPKLAEDTEELMRRGGWGGTGEVPGHLSQSMPRHREHILPAVVTNPLVVQVTERVLGMGLHLHFYNGNTNLPGSQQQPLHRDAAHLWPDPIHPSISVIVNMCLTDVDEDNGAIEMWPGTHRTLGSTRITADAEAARRDVCPPVRGVTRAGDVLLRSPRLWHRGMPNLSTRARHMVAMVHSRWFYLPDVAIPVTRAALHCFDHDVLRARVIVVPDDYDYLAEVVAAI